MADTVLHPNNPIHIEQPPPGHSTVTTATLPDDLASLPQSAAHVFKADGDAGNRVAVAAFSVSNFGVFASSDQGVGLSVVGGDHAADFQGDIAVTGNCDVTGTLHSDGDYLCGGNSHTIGNHTVDGDIQLSGADYAEDFDIGNPDGAAPGMVMVLDDTGGVRVSDEAYDRRVAGVISGAGGYKPAVILDRQSTGGDRRPLALMGKVYCRVDASSASIAVGDLLTTSSTPGHAMKATDQTLAFGAVLGKALRPLAEGRGLVPILVTLQ